MGVMVVVLATAIAASAAVASASAAQFRGESYPVGFNASIASTLEMTTNNGLVKCSEGSLTGSETSASSQAGLAPSLKCKVYGLAGKVASEGCQFTFNSSEEEALTGSLGVSCTGESAGIKVTATGSNCVVTIPAQAAVSGVTYSNSGTGSSRTISAASNVSGFTYKETGTNCVKNGVTSTNSTVKGTLAIHGTSVPSVYDVGLYLASAQIEEPAAEGPKFRQPSYPASTEVTSQLEGEVVFGTESGAKKCTGFSMSGTQLSSAAGLTLHPIFTGCKAFGLTEPVTTTGCNFVINIPGSSITVGALSIVCEPGHEIIKGPATGSNCVTTYPTQLRLGSVTFANQGSGETRTVKATINLSGMSYTETGSFCARPGSHSNGTMSATVTLKGTHSFTQQALWIQ